VKTQKIFLIYIMVVLLAVLSFPNAVFAASPHDEGTGADFAPNEILVKFKPDVSPSEAAQVHRQLGGQVKEIIPSVGVQVLTVPAGKVKEKVKAYSAEGKVQYAEANYLCEVVDAPDDAYFNNQWGMRKVEATEAWDATKGSSSIKIAILDTGVDLDHPDLSGKISKVINFTSSTTADDVYGHGTHVAGIAAADTDNGIGVAGLGYFSSIADVKVLGDNGKGYYSWIAEGIIWAADNGAQVINLSLGGSSASSTLEDAVNYAWSKGVIVVAAAGNNGNSTPFYPAYYSNSIAVAATDANDNLASWSNRGDWVDLAAPGVSIYSTLKDGGYGNKSGTSMATPHVSGLAALVFTVVSDSNGNGILNDEVLSRIEAGADDIGLSGIGRGRINAFKAVSASPSAPGSITGRVTDAASETPIAGATVSDGVVSVVTGSNGEYVIPNVPQGSYIVTASAQDYASVSQPVLVASEQISTVSFVLTSLAPPPVTQNMWVKSITFSSRRGNLKVTVGVTSSAGVVPGASVGIELAGSGGQSWSFSGTTDSSGTVSFTVSKAPSGDYTANVTGLSADGYDWDPSQGITSAGYSVISSRGNKGKGKSGK
jgi:thermitase